MDRAVLSTETAIPWIGKASYWTPTHLVPSAWHEHAPFAFWLIDALRPKTFVELGSHNGFSYFAVCETVQRLGLETTCSAIDSWEGDEHAGFYGDEVFAAVAEINEREYSSFSRLIRAYFSDAVEQFEDGSIELLHIDGRHRYEDAVEDFEAYRAKLAPSAVVIFHDTFEFDRGFGVHRLWAELEASHPDSTFHFEHGHGLGVLGLGPDLPPAIVDFFARGRAHAQTIREDYSSLGRVIDARAEMLVRQEEASAAIAAQSTMIAALQAEIAQLEPLAEDRGRRLNELQNSTTWRLTKPLRSTIDRFRRS